MLKMYDKGKAGIKTSHTHPWGCSVKEKQTQTILYVI